MVLTQEEDLMSCPPHILVSCTTERRVLFFETLSLLLEHFTEKSGKLRLFPLPICNFSRMQEKLEERYGTNYSHVPMIQHLGKHGLFQPVKKI